MNPIDINEQIENVKQIRVGGFILVGSHRHRISEINEIVEKGLSLNYDVHLLKSADPQIRLL